MTGSTDPNKHIADIVEGSLEEDDYGCDAGDLGGSDGGGLPPGITLDMIAGNAVLDQNDTDNARRLLNLYGDRLLNVDEVGMHAWEGRYWKREGGDHEAERCAQQTAKMIKLEHQYLPVPEIVRIQIERASPLKARDEESLSAEEKMMLALGAAAETALEKRHQGRVKFGISCGNRARTVAMIQQAVPHITVTPAALDAAPLKCNVQNGTLVFEVKEIEEEDLECPDPDVVRMVRRKVASVRLDPHRREDRISKMACCSYDPKATAPRFTAFMERFQPDDAQRRYLQVAAGRGLLGGASTQCLIFLYGDGSNGKSVWMELMARILGDYAGRMKPESITGSQEQAGDRPTPDFARLAGKRFVAIAELPRNSPLREGLIKTMTGSEPMPVRHLNKGFFDLTPEFIPFMSGNEMPVIGGLDKGIWRRMKFVHWPVTLTDDEQRPFEEVVGEMFEEASGILNWLIDGAIIFLEQGLREPPGVRALTQSHREDSDPVGAFVRDCVKPDPGGQVQARAMYTAFAKYCASNAIKPWTEKSFSNAMKQKGFKREDKRIRQWLDVTLDWVPDCDPQPPHREDEH
ncbi:DNA primase [Rhodomicrobium udaipurense JA643]|uniref:DNA primase family protein n=1 Tax=Rhodomicrobium udaipurense TaxID=1202716 RepID=A0A8I1GG63_9HYPH|nr:DNA primase family protein [Rhodomicrobium udaipurense]KAI93930.1 DNA primase [Rhodomicrobium udaipurense JA643]MBJ7543246.1 DNA primase family protein [Rhodomicrobium udaipurense]